MERTARWAGAYACYVVAAYFGLYGALAINPIALGLAAAIGYGAWRLAPTPEPGGIIDRWLNAGKVNEEEQR